MKTAINIVVVFILITLASCQSFFEAGRASGEGGRKPTKVETESEGYREMVEFLEEKP